MTGGTSAQATAAHAVDNPQTSLMSYGRRDCPWWRGLCSLFSEALLCDGPPLTHLRDPE